MRLLNWFQSAALAAVLVSTASAQSTAPATKSALTTGATQTYASANANAANSAPASLSAIPATATTYAGYQGEVAELRAKPLSSREEIDVRLESMGGQNPRNLTAGWMSYSALITAQNKEFAAGVRDIEAYYGREVLMNALSKGSYVMQIKGADRALQGAYAAAEADAQHMQATANFMEAQQADLQNQKWIKERIYDGQQRATRLKSLASAATAPVSDHANELFTTANIETLLSDSGSAAIWDRASRIASNAPRSALTSFTGRQYSVDRAYTGTARNMAALAAYEIMDAADTSVAGVSSAMNDTTANRCFSDASFELRGCVAAMSEHYGLQACLRKHAIEQMGSCVDGIAQ